MSKPVKNIIIRDYRDRMGGVDDALVISIRGLKGTDTTTLRRNLAKKNIRFTLVRNNLARQALGGSGLKPLLETLTGANALVYGGQSVVEVAREMVEAIAKFPAVELKAAILDGQMFNGAAGVKELSKFPTREEAIGRVVTLVVSPARKLVAQVQGPGATVAGIIKAIETKLEKNEAITKIA